MSKVLLVDDEKHIREDLGTALGEENYIAYTVSSVEEARKIILCEALDYAIIDLTLDFESEFGGIKIFNFAKRNQPKLKPIILSAYAFKDVEEKLKKELKGEYEAEKMLEEIQVDYISKGGGENYIDAVLDKLKALEQKREKKNCFVIMPYSTTDSCTEGEWTKIFKDLIKPAVEGSGFNYECYRSNLVHGSIIENILDNLNRSDLVIADITDSNRNVLYELGVRHTLGGLTIVIAQNISHVPFDLQSDLVSIYKWKSDEGREKFKAEIKKIIAFIEENPKKAVSPVRRYLDPIAADSK